MLIESKAGSKAEKRRKRGRPRLADVMREPNGRPSRRKFSQRRRREETERETKEVVIAARLRHGLPPEYAGLQEAGSILGRMMICFPELIKRHHFEAGQRMAECFARYYALTGIPYPSPRAHDIVKASIRAGWAPYGGQDRETATKKATNDVMKIEQAIAMADVSGRAVTMVVKRVCIEERAEQMQYPHMVGYLVRGLDALVDLFDIDHPDKPFTKPKAILNS